jgi:hypothetical protein
MGPEKTASVFSISGPSAESHSTQSLVPRDGKRQPLGIRTSFVFEHVVDGRVQPCAEVREFFTSLPTRRGKIVHDTHTSRFKIPTGNVIIVFAACEWNDTSVRVSFLHTQVTDPKIFSAHDPPWFQV